MLISDEVVLRLNAISALWSRKLPLPDSYSAPEPEKPAARVPDPLPPEPAGSAGRRMDRPIEELPDGRVKVRGYRRKTTDWLTSWEESINR